MKKKSTEDRAATDGAEEMKNGGKGAATTDRARGRAGTPVKIEPKADETRDGESDFPGAGHPKPDADPDDACRRGPDDGGAATRGDAAALPQNAADAAPDDAVFRDIITKAAEGNIKYQELYLKYIDLISGKMADGDEIVYEATFIDDEDKEA